MRAILLSLIVSALLTASVFAQGFNLPYGSDPHLLFDWYVPTGGGGPHPCVMYIHGGPGDKSDAPFFDGSLPDLFLKNGITLMAINFRPSPEYVYPAQLEDAATAMQFFREHATTYNIDPDRLAIWGVSAGAVLGGWLAYGPDMANPNGSPQEQQSTRPQAFINIVGLTNFTLMAPTSASYIYPGVTIGDLDPVFLKSVSFAEMVLDVPRTFTPPVVSLYGPNENPPPLTDPHDVTLMKNLHLKLEAFPDVHAASKAIQKLEGVFNNDNEDITAWLLKRFAIPHQLNLGRSLAGTGGLAPDLEATGNWAPGGTVSVTLQASTASATALWLMASHNDLNAQFKGGVLVPEPTIMFTFVTAPNGTLTFGSSLPPWLGTAEEFYLQFWQLDPQGPKGFAASNAILATLDS